MQKFNIYGSQNPRIKTFLKDICILRPLFKSLTENFQYARTCIRKKHLAVSSQRMRFLVGVSEENPFFCSFVQHHQLELQTSKTYSKRQKLVQNKNIDVQNLENIGSPLGVFHSNFFRHYATFLDSTKGSPLRLFRYFATQSMSKNALLHFSAL